MTSFDKRLDVVSAGTEPSDKVHPNAVKVMKELGFDLSLHQPKSVEEFLDTNFDYLITVCGGAKEACPAFMGEVKNRVHIGFDDPAEAEGTDDYVLSEFIRIRDEINKDFKAFYESNIKAQLDN